LRLSSPDGKSFRDVDRRWHARLKGADTPVMVHGEDLVDLRDEIIIQIRKDEEKEWQLRRRPEGSTL